MCSESRTIKFKIGMKSGNSFVFALQENEVSVFFSDIGRASKTEANISIYVIPNTLYINVREIEFISTVHPNYD